MFKRTIHVWHEKEMNHKNKIPGWPVSHLMTKRYEQFPLVHKRTKQHTPAPSLWSSGQSSWLQIQRSWVRFPALPDFLRSSESIQPSEDNWGAIWMKKPRLRSRKPILSALGMRCSDQATPSTAKVGTKFADKRRRWVGIVLLQTKCHRVCLAC
jgi:hypothetical protein